MLENGVTYSNQAIPYQADLENELTAVFDPDIGIDIVNLGLIYEVSLDEQDNCLITMTYTSPQCNCHDIIAADIHKALGHLDYVKDIVLDIVWDPAWDMSRITRFGRMALGIAPKR